MAELQIDHLTIATEKAGRSVEVISRIDVTIEPGQVVALVGELGAGKSMIARAIAGQLPDGFRVSQGTVRFADRDVLAMTPTERRRLLGREIAFIPQEPMGALDPIMTIGRQFDEHLRRVGSGGARERRKRAIELLELVHLPRATELLESYRHELSGGMCQRVLIAMAFAGHPKLIVADEPTTALDVSIQARVLKVMEEMRRVDKSALVFITHDLRLASRIADRIVVLYAGRVAERGPTRAVFSEPRHPYTRSLLLAIPPITGEDRSLLVMADRMPGLEALAQMQGCPFAPRCAVASNECRDSETFASAQGAQASACLFPERAGRIDPGPLKPRLKASSQSIVLEVRALSKTFVRRTSLFAPARRVAALKNVSLALRQGEFLGVVGEFGSGKSTLAKVLVGLETHDSGEIVMPGIDMEAKGRLARRKRSQAIQMVFQDPQSALNPRRKVWRLVVQMLEAAQPGLAKAERLQRAQTLLTEMGLSAEAAERYPAELSGGQKQRVNIARALCVLPKVLVADEIVSGLDVSVQAQLLELLLSLREAHGFSMILISHDLSVVRHLCDRVIVMRAGEIVESGEPSQMLSAPRDPYTRMLISSVPPDDPDTPWRPIDAGELERI